MSRTLGGRFLGCQPSEVEDRASGPEGFRHLQVEAERPLHVSSCGAIMGGGSSLVQSAVHHARGVRWRHS